MSAVSMFVVVYSCCCCLLARTATAEKILLMPLMYGSHVYENLHLGNALIKKGHEVYMVLPKVSKYNAVVQRSRVKPLTFSAPDDLLLMESKQLMDKMYDMAFYDGNFFSYFLDLMRSGDECCDAMMRDVAFIHSVRQHRFDLVITCGFQTSWCFMLLPHHLNIPYVTLTTFVNPWDAGIPALPSFNQPILENAAPPFTLWQKLTNTATKIIYSYTFNPSLKLPQEMEPRMTSGLDLFRRSQLFIIQRDYHLDWPAPSMPNVIHTPTLSYAPAKALEPEVMSKLEQAETIVVCFGSAADKLPTDVAAKFVDAFRQFSNYNIMWRLRDYGNLQLPSNVHALSWLPQNDLLGHVSTKLFISHCGLNSIDEALYHAVPLLCFPLFLDQDQNAFIAQRRHYAVRMNIKNFTAAELTQTMHDVISNAQIRSSVNKASLILRDWRAPADEITYWIKHVMKYGGEHLRPVTLDMPLYELFCLDLVAMFVMCLFLLIAFVVGLCCACARYCRGASTSSGKKKRE